MVDSVVVSVVEAVVLAEVEAVVLAEVLAVVEALVDAVVEAVVVVASDSSGVSLQPTKARTAKSIATTIMRERNFFMIKFSF